MYRDNTLIPSEAVRLLALGILADGERHYAELASEVRNFTSHVVGPSLDLVGSPLELLKIEGLIEPVDGSGMRDNAPLRITSAGRSELNRLMTSNVRAPVNDINKLIIALKMRFLHLLAPADQRLQLEVLVEMSERELARLVSLRGQHSGQTGYLTAWLDHDIEAVEGRLAWFRELQANTAAA
jgi:DNA-binding PadR family transcriptional regulator